MLTKKSCNVLVFVYKMGPDYYAPPPRDTAGEHSTQDQICSIIVKIKGYTCFICIM